MGKSSGWVQIAPIRAVAFVATLVLAAGLLTVPAVVLAPPAQAAPPALEPPTAHVPDSATAAPGRVSRGPDGSLWFPVAPSTVVRVSPAGAVSRYPAVDVTGGASVVAPDGSFWYAGSNAENVIFRMAPDGTSTRMLAYRAETFGYEVGDMAATADSSVWVTFNDGVARGGGSIARISPAGIVTKFKGPTAFGFYVNEPRGIAVGADGALWFTSVDVIGRIDPDGTLTMRNGPRTASPTRITTGPDGALWYVNQTNPVSISRLDTGPFASNFGTNYATTITATVKDIAPGPDGNVWLSLSDNRIARMSTSGVVLGYTALPTFTNAYDFELGADGAMWFTQELSVVTGQRYLLGRIALATPPTVPFAPVLGVAVGDRELRVAWTVANGGPPLTSVTVTATPGGGSCTWTEGPQMCAISGLTNGMTYSLRAQATNGAGTGRPSVTAFAMPLAPAARPGFVRADNVDRVGIYRCRDDVEIRVSWWPPPGDPVTRSVVTPYVDGVAQAPRSEIGAATQRQICPSGQDWAGHEVQFTVQLFSGVAGTNPGPVSLRTTVLVAGRPSAPRWPRAIGGDGSAVVGWVPLANTPVTGATITPVRDGVAQPAVVVADANQVVSGLTNGATYTFRIALTNAFGAGPVVETAPVVIGPAAQPAFVTSRSGSGTATVSWWPSQLPITASIITPHLDGVALAPITFPGPAATQVITGLENGRSYTFTVVAVNGVGPSAPSAPTAPIAVGAPLRPAFVSAVAGPTKLHPTDVLRPAIIRWWPIDANASPVTSVTVTVLSAGAPIATQSFPGAPTEVVLAVPLNETYTYSFTVAATNAFGQGASSVPTSPIGLFYG